jgi:hypothetical protein
MRDKLFELYCYYTEQIIKLSNSENSQNIYGEYYKDGLIGAYTEFVEKLGELLRETN